LYCFAATCSLPSGEVATYNLSDADITALRLECFYANPFTDGPVILSGMAKTASARQEWIRSAHPSITEVLEQYPQLEDMPLDLVCRSVVHQITILSLIIGPGINQHVTRMAPCIYQCECYSRYHFTFSLDMHTTLQQ
jgi:hypothetical protein